MISLKLVAPLIPHCLRKALHVDALQILSANLGRTEFELYLFDRAPEILR